MKKIIFFNIFLALTFLFSTSCDEELNLAPKSDISDPTYWKNANDFKLAANYFYSYLVGYTFDDNNSDIAFDLSPTQLSNGTAVAPASSYVNWDLQYNVIRNCNKLLEMGEKYANKDEIKIYVGEAKFFRALNYFHLFRQYGGVPLVKTVLDVNSPDLFGERATRDATIDFILQDLDEAIAVLPLKGASESGRATKGAALTLKARASLFEGTWRKFHNTGDANAMLDKAIAASGEVIASGKYSLHPDYRRLFIMAGDNSAEVIFDIRRKVGVWEHDFSSWVGSGRYNPTRKLAEMYLSIDGLPISKSPIYQGEATFTSEYQSRDGRMVQTMITPGIKILRPMEPSGNNEQWPAKGNNRNVMSGYMIYKFLEENPAGLSWSTADFDWHYLRYGEVLLIYAEAIFERNGNISDTDLNKSINELRKRAGFPPTAYLTNDFVTANGLDMRTEIRRERTVELAFEGFRRDDLNRWKTAETELPKAVRSVKVIGTQWETYTLFEFVVKNNLYDADGYIVLEKAENRTFDPAKHYLMPLPTKQVALNPKLAQNPKW